MKETDKQYQKFNSKNESYEADIQTSTPPEKSCPIHSLKHSKQETKKFSFPAVFANEENGFVSVTFPDIPEAVTCGEGHEHAVEMAKECLGLCIQGRIEDGEEIPEVTRTSAADINIGSRYIVQIEIEIEIEMEIERD